MLVRLETYVVNEFWPTMKKALISMNGEIKKPEKVLQALLDESIQCWLIVDGVDLIGFVNTQMFNGGLENSKMLAIKDFYSLNGLPDDIATGMSNHLETFAKSNDCGLLVAYADDEEAVKVAVSQGYRTVTMIIKEIE